MLVLLEEAREGRVALTVPATALAQAMRSPARQARLSRLIRQPEAQIEPLDAPDASAVGLLLAGTDTTDIVDAHVAFCARRADQVVVTSDPDDMRRLDPELPLFVI